MRKIFLNIALCLFLGNLTAVAQLPIKVTRTISFTTEEGSNMNVDISPDGKTIVFDLLGDLYIVPSEGGEAIQLTRGIAVNTCPIWGPKGDQIAYISDASGDNRLTVMNMETKMSQTFDKPTKGIPVWFGSNNWVTTSNYFFRDFPLYHLSGMEATLKKDMFDITGTSTDHRLIYYKETTNSDSWNVKQYDISTGEKKELGKWEKKEVEGVKISKDARCLSYLHREGASCSLMLVNLLTQKEKLLACWQHHVPASLGNYGFSADSKNIVIGYGGKIHLIDVETGKDEIVPFKAEVKVDMGKLNEATFKINQDSLQAKYLRSAQISPDGKQLLFAALGRIYIMDFPYGKPRVLINQSFNQFHPSWSTDGKWIAFVSWSDQDFGQVWKVRVNGKDLSKITHEAGAYYYPSWSPDGEFIAVTKANLVWEGKPILKGRSPGLGTLLSISLRNGSLKRIVDSVQVINRVEYTNNGGSIIYKPQLLNGDGNYLPCLISIDLSNKKKSILALTTKPDNRISEEAFRHIIFSQNGKYIVYQNEENLYLASVVLKSSPILLYNHPMKGSVIRFARGGCDPHWEQGGNILSWSYANQYFQIDPEKIIVAAIDSAKRRSNNIPQPEILDIDIIPDKTISIDLKVPQKTGKGLLALKNVRIITMKRDQIIENGTALIKDGRFLVVGKAENVKIPNEAKVMDLIGKTIMPGLIDLHDHVGCPDEVFPQQKWDFLANLAYGSTTAREPAGGQDNFGYEELLRTGQMIGPRFFSVGSAVSNLIYPNLNNLKEARIIAKNRVRMGAVVVKQYLQPSRLKRQWLLQACEEVDLNMTNEIEATMRGFLGQIKDGTSGIEHNPLWGEAYGDVIKLVATSGTYFTPTLQATLGTQSAKYVFTNYFTKLGPKLTRFYPEKEIVRRSLEKPFIAPNEPSFLSHSKVNAAIRHAGGLVTVGSHGEHPGLGAHFEIWALQMGGLSNLEALQAATIMAAGALGMQKDLGSIEPGKIADLIILNKNPLDNIRNTIEIQSVMKDGVLYDGNTLDEIWPVKKKFKYTKTNY